LMKVYSNICLCFFYFTNCKLITKAFY
jgi:hypothetical protein